MDLSLAGSHSCIISTATDQKIDANANEQVNWSLHLEITKLGKSPSILNHQPEKILSLIVLDSESVLPWHKDRESGKLFCESVLCPFWAVMTNDDLRLVSYSILWKYCSSSLKSQLLASKNLLCYSIPLIINAAFMLWQK